MSGSDGDPSPVAFIRKTTPVNTDIPWYLQPLETLTPEQWEQICDGCGLCCLIRLEDEDSGVYHFTNLACRLFDIETCQCRDYVHRLQSVPECIQLLPLDPDKIDLMPPSCAYRLRFEGRPLPDWHHLVCGDRQAIHRRTVTPRGKVISEEHVHPRQVARHIVDWFDGDDGESAGAEDRRDQGNS